MGAGEAAFSFAVDDAAPVPNVKLGAGDASFAAVVALGAAPNENDAGFVFPVLAWF